MSPEIILFLLRVISALLLLGFLGSLFWFLYKDIKIAQHSVGDPTKRLGRLRVIANPHSTPPENSTFELTYITSIGRNPRNTIVLDNSYVSGEHALLIWRDSNWWLEDLDSRNGTLLNDLPVGEPTVISTGDIVAIGNIQLKLELQPDQGGEKSG
jgi:pSer/pThr/pTyr-binding forkhead associated (FHA) protein